MNPLLKEIRPSPLLWMLIFVPIVLVAERVAPSSHTILFVLAILAIVPLAALLSHATESVAEKTGDAIGGLLNATLGNLTELIIAIAALQAGEYMLVKASIAGAIVTNSLFMLGASFLLGGLKHRIQEYNWAGVRLYSALLLMAAIALLAPAAVADLDLAQGEVVSQKLSTGLAVLLIAAYGLGLLFSPKTHKDLLVLASCVIGPKPMDLQFWPGAVTMVMIAAVTCCFITNSGRSAWFIGALLLFIYTIFAMTLYVVPPGTHAPA
jgi:Ca2+:H+ antiporter